MYSNTAFSLSSQNNGLNALHASTSLSRIQDEECTEIKDAAQYLLELSNDLGASDIQRCLELKDHFSGEPRAPIPRRIMQSGWPRLIF